MYQKQPHSQLTGVELLFGIIEMVSQPTGMIMMMILCMVRVACYVSLLNCGHGLICLKSCGYCLSIAGLWTLYIAANSSIVLDVREIIGIAHRRSAREIVVRRW